jgi:hypothetical protein
VTKKKSPVHVDSDRERILTNIAGYLASELASLQALPIVKNYMNGPHSMTRIRADWFRDDLQKGDLVLCATSIGRQQHPWLVSFVEADYRRGQEQCLLRAIGTDSTCNYGNESFTRITGIPESLLWEGKKRQFEVKLKKAFRQFDMYIHRFRGLEFPTDGMAHVFIGEIWGGLAKKTKPYCITVTFTPKTTVKAIVSALKDQGLGTREFETDDGAYDGPMQGLTSFTRESLVKSLEADGFQLKD